MTWRPDPTSPPACTTVPPHYSSRCVINSLNVSVSNTASTTSSWMHVIFPSRQVNNAFSVEKGDSALAFTTRDRVNKEEVRQGVTKRLRNVP